MSRKIKLNRSYESKETGEVLRIEKVHSRTVLVKVMRPGNGKARTGNEPFKVKNGQFVNEYKRIPSLTSAP
jgi:hypothetical protein